jgi:ribosomal protein L7/L12
MAKLGSCKTCQGMVSSEAPVCPHCGQPNPYNGDDLGEVRLLVKQGQKIAAIRRLRELRPWLELREAKDFVEEM